MDYTLKIYKDLLLSLQNAGYHFQKFEDFVMKPCQKAVVLRHDVDRLIENALNMAVMESELKIQASYYFRVVSPVWNKPIMKKIASLGHEVSYHYEDMTIKQGNIEEAVQHFEEQLKRFRKIYPSKTICMHGSPLSKWDNRLLWEKYDYRDFGITAEPYFDVDYSEVFYITDTGRAWNDESVSVRDKVRSSFNIEITSTFEMIKLVKDGKMPDKIMINAHPHRWFNPGFGWFKELVEQNLKNVIKSMLIKIGR